MPAHKMLVASGLAAVLALAAATVAASAAQAPKVAARPHKLMVGTETTVKGKGEPTSKPAATCRSRLGAPSCCGISCARSLGRLRKAEHFRPGFRASGSGRAFSARAG